MSEKDSPQAFEDLAEAELIQFILDGFRRSLIHYGCWFREVDYQLGTERAVQVEKEAGDQAWSIILNRLSKILGFEIEGGVPKALTTMSKEELIKVLDGVAVNWLANDGVWFQTVERNFGMDTAKRCNDTCWTRFSPYEAFRIKELLGLPPRPGLDGLRRALAFRLYARINKQSIHPVDANSFIFRMDDCRVQSARKRKGLDDYPCKSVGTVEYPFFAHCVDDRIVTECVGCPPDPHPEEWYCAWKFTLKD